VAPTLATDNYDGNTIPGHVSGHANQNQERDPRYQEQKGGLSLSDIEAEAQAVYQGKLFLANDLERSILDKEGVLTKAR
jgi:hypothetical protein